MCPHSARRSNLIKGPVRTPVIPGVRGRRCGDEGACARSRFHRLWGPQPEPSVSGSGWERPIPPVRGKWPKAKGGRDEQGSGRSFRRPGGNGAKRTLRRRGASFGHFCALRNGHPRSIPRNASVVGTLPLIRPSVRTGAPSPRGRWHGGAVTDEGSPRAETSFYRFLAPCGPSSASFGGTPQR